MMVAHRPRILCIPFSCQWQITFRVQTYWKKQLFQPLFICHLANTCFSAFPADLSWKIWPLAFGFHLLCLNQTLWSYHKDEFYLQLSISLMIFRQCLSMGICVPLLFLWRSNCYQGRSIWYRKHQRWNQVVLVPNSIFCCPKMLGCLMSNYQAMLISSIFQAYESVL